MEVSLRLLIIRMTEIVTATGHTETETTLEIGLPVIVTATEIVTGTAERGVALAGVERMIERTAAGVMIVPAKKTVTGTRVTARVGIAATDVVGVAIMTVEMTVARSASPAGAETGIGAQINKKVRSTKTTRHSLTRPRRSAAHPQEAVSMGHHHAEADLGTEVVLTGPHQDLGVTEAKVVLTVPLISAADEEAVGVGEDETMEVSAMVVSVAVEEEVVEAEEAGMMMLMDSVATHLIRWEMKLVVTRSLIQMEVLAVVVDVEIDAAVTAETGAVVDVTATLEDVTVTLEDVTATLEDVTATLEGGVGGTAPGRRRRRMMTGRRIMLRRRDPWDLMVFLCGLLSRMWRRTRKIKQTKVKKTLRLQNLLPLRDNQLIRFNNQLIRDKKHPIRF
jgi:hypothetical protein